MKHFSRGLVLLVTLMSSTSCRKADHSRTIYTSFYPIYDFTKRIVGDKYDVVNLTPAGSEPHDYEPKAREVIGMSEAKAVFLNGLGLESWIDGIPQEMTGNQHVVTTGIPTMTINGVVDPHVWLSVKNAMTELFTIKDTMCGLDPDNSDYFEANYTEALSSFEALELQYRTRIATRQNRYLVVSHAAFGYLCDAYGLTQVYVSGLNPEDEPTPKAMEAIIEQVKTYDISTIFYEELVSPDISEKIAKETGVKTESLNPLEGLSTEELATEDYLSVMKDNLEKIMEADNHDSV